ncbi:MAG: MaoC family dehydratase [Rhodobiaceae bacterium]|nr:MaoC family dehydratase [Rhodobiaceae bacterium]MCC0056367.1 MaoC family dehydratase [Rhodobiaceae bacterium]
MMFVEEMSVGQVLELGDYVFTEAEIIEFARKYDPHYFHVDAEAAKKGPFGALTASGWHTLSAWMNRYCTTLQRLEKEAAEKQEPFARFGPAPGLKNMKWLKPVYVDMTVRFTTTILGKRPSGSRPEWGLVHFLHEGHSLDGELVSRHESHVFIELKAPAKAG